MPLLPVPEVEKQALFRDKMVIFEALKSTPRGGNPIAEAVTKYKAAAAVSIQQPGYAFDLYDYGLARPIVQVSYDERERLKGYASSPAVMRPSNSAIQFWGRRFQRPSSLASRAGVRASAAQAS